MTMIRTLSIASLALAAGLFMAGGPAQAASAGRQKPRPPVQVEIAPMLSSPTAAAKAGDALEIRVMATPATDATEMRILCTLSEGVELVGGDLTWSGPARKGAEHAVSFTVRSKQGSGTVSARVEIFAGRDLLFTTTADYALGAPEKKRPEKPRALRKDRKGQIVEEYR